MADLTHLFGGVAFDPRADTTHGTPEQQLRQAMQGDGLEPPEQIRFDGHIHRFGQEKRSWYVAFSNGVPAGAYGNWKTHDTIQWRADVGRSMTDLEEIQYAQNIANLKKQREEKAKVAADTVEEIWAGLEVADASHAYLQSHGVQPHGVRVTGDGRLMVPAYNQDRELSSAQYIEPGRGKRFHAGGSMSGAVWWIGDLTGEYETVYVAEGFATAAAVHEETGCLTIIAFSAHNLTNAAGFVRQVHGDTKPMVIVADNDKSGTGQMYASQACATHGGRWIMPPTTGEDACDYRQKGEDLKELLEPKGSGFLMSGVEAASRPEPPQWLIKKWLVKESVSMVHGMSGVGKSFFVVDAALRIACGIPDFHGEKVNKGPVVYLAGEGQFGLRLRIAAWLKTHGVSANDLSEFWLSREGCDLDTTEGLTRVLGEIQSLPVRPALIIIDTLHRFMVGDENSAQDTGAMIRACERLKNEFGSCVLMVHHQGNQGNGRLRGSSAWKGALDTEIKLTKSGSLVVVETAKQKDAEPAKPTQFTIDQVPMGFEDEDGEEVISAIAASAGAPEPKQDEPDEKWRIFERAWWKSGMEDVQGRPYLARAAFRRWMEEEGWSDNQVKNALKSNESKRLIGFLLDKGFVEPALHGWVVIRPELGASLMIRRGTA